MKTDNPYLIIIAFLLVTTMSGCTKNKSCPDAQTTTIDLTPASLSKVPYTGYETISFLNKQGDTCIVAGTGKQYYYNTKSKNSTTNCTSDQTKTQGFTIKFAPVRGDLSFNLSLFGNSLLEIDVKMYRYTFEFESNQIGVLDDQFDLDSMIINNKTYKMVDRAYTVDGISWERTNNDDYQVYYNTQFGVLKIINNENGEEYSILRK